MAASEDVVGLVIGGGVMTVGGLIVAYVGHRARRGTLPRNRWAGIRLPSTMRDDRSWDAAHRPGGAPMLVAGLVAAALGFLGIVLGLTTGDGAAAMAMLAAAAVLLIGVLWSCAVGLRAVRVLRDSAR
jgi:uncharacterized membrane protein